MRYKFGWKSSQELLLDISVTVYSNDKKALHIFIE